MIFRSRKYHRRSIRLKGYDYRKSGAYYVTLCTRKRKCIFGKVKDGEMHLNDLGRIVEESWYWLGEQYHYVHLDTFGVMPNHIHGIIVIRDCRGGSRSAPKSSATAQKRKPLGQLIGAFKTVSTKRMNQIRHTPGQMVWQRNYHEHIIRNQADWDRISKYIRDNPLYWEKARNIRNRQIQPGEDPDTDL